MRRLAAGMSIALLALTAGCGGSEKKADTPPAFDPSSSPSAPQTPSESPSASATAVPFDDKGHESVPGRVVAANARQKAVADAWLAYWKVRADSYGTAKADPAAIGKVASGEAATNIVKYVRYLQANKLHTVGDSRIGVSKVRVSGPTAAVVSCMENLSIDRREDGTPAEERTPYYQFTGVLTSTGGTWLVMQVVKTSNGRCRA